MLVNISTTYQVVEIVALERVAAAADDLDRKTQSKADLSFL
ncbi:MAG TPA: hypothetical protein VME47_15665 [Acetobacteraceae bacterium]|nr:hypothetical protein [Acetobacteraceae bacterium]